MFFFFFNDTATTEIYTLSLHDALPISNLGEAHQHLGVIYLHLGLLDEAVAELRNALTLNPFDVNAQRRIGIAQIYRGQRSEEHTSELQSLAYLVCRLLLEKKKYTL